MNIDKDQILQLLRSQARTTRPARPAASCPARSTPATPSTPGSSPNTASTPAPSPASSAAWANSSDRTREQKDARCCDPAGTAATVMNCPPRCGAPARKRRIHRHGARQRSADPWRGRSGRQGRLHGSEGEIRETWRSLDRQARSRRLTRPLCRVGRAGNRQGSRLRPTSTAGRRVVPPDGPWPVGTGGWPWVMRWTSRSAANAAS
jgi:hypothetical protein